MSSLANIHSSEMFLSSSADDSDFEDLNWHQIGQGKYKFRHSFGRGKVWIAAPKHGKGLTVDPIDAACFEIKQVDHRYCSMKLNGRYVFAGDQATVKLGKKKVGTWEQFEVRVAERNGVKVCSIKCKRDQQYWYIDKDGMVRHRTEGSPHYMEFEYFTC